jgi:uncharacterized protein YbaR (Trm112 family)
MPAPPECLAILRCPITHRELRPANSHELDVVNVRLFNGKLRTIGWFTVDHPVPHGVVAVGHLLYPVVDEIHLLPPGSAIDLAPDTQVPASPPGPLADIKEGVRLFYEEVAWESLSTFGVGISQYGSPRRRCA